MSPDRLKRRRSNGIVTAERLEDRRLLAVTAPAVTGLVLYNADTGNAIGPLQNNATLDYAALPTRNLSVRASTSGGAESVRFGLDGNANFSTENYAPYSIRGDDDATGRPKAWTPSLGTHALAVRAYSADYAKGTASEALNVTFKVIDGGTSDPKPSSTGVAVWFSDDDADAREAGLDKGTWVISRSGSTVDALTVEYAVSGTATNGVDYQTLSGSLTIAAGSSSANLIIVPIDDSLVEGTETVIVTLSGSSAYTLSTPAAATAPIIDNDTTAPVGTLSFKSIANNPLARAEAIGGTVNGKLYVLGGLHTVDGKILAIKRSDVYDPATNSWRRLRDMPFTPITHAGTAIDGKYIWFVGSYLGNHPGPGFKAVYRYDTSNDTWRRGPDLNVDRGAGAAAIVGRKLYFFGGMNADRNADQSDHFVLDLDNTSAGWQRKASLPSARNHVSGAALNGYVYVIGGQKNQEENQVALSSVYRYDPATDKWTQVASLPGVRSHTTGATFTHEGRIIVVGGETGFNTNRREVFSYNPATNKWSQIGLLPWARSTMVAGIINGKLYASTGNRPSASNAGFVGTFG